MSCMDQSGLMCRCITSLDSLSADRVDDIMLLCSFNCKNCIVILKLAVKAKSPTSIMTGKPAAGIVDRELAAEYQVTFCKFFSYCVVPENFPTEGMENSWRGEGGKGS